MNSAVLSPAQLFDTEADILGTCLQEGAVWWRKVEQAAHRMRIEDLFTVSEHRLVAVAISNLYNGSRGITGTNVAEVLAPVVGVPSVSAFIAQLESVATLRSADEVVESAKKLIDQHRSTSSKDVLFLDAVPKGLAGFDISAIAAGNWAGSLAESDVDILGEYLHEPANILGVVGSPGTGKSSLAVTVARHLVNRDDLNAEFVTADELAYSIFSKGFLNAPPFIEMSSRYRETDVLVVDGIRVGETTMLAEFIGERIATGKRSIVTGGNDAELRRWISDNGWDSKIIRMGGESLKD